MHLSGPFFCLFSLLYVSVSHSDVINDLPIVQECTVGKRFIVNHILFVCHQFGERRSFRPFGWFFFDWNPLRLKFLRLACATENDISTAQLIGQNTTYNERFFRYKCERVGHKLTYKPLSESASLYVVQNLNCSVPPERRARDTGHHN